MTCLAKGSIWCPKGLCGKKGLHPSPTLRPNNLENIVENGDSAGKSFLSLSKPIPSTDSLPNNKVLDWSKLKAFADDKINLNDKSKLVLGRAYNIVGKGENAGYQHFPFPTMFS